MSTFNGSLYLKDQLDSIFFQNVDADVQLFVRDDGSIDDTVLQLEEYSKKNHVDIIIDRGKNVGPSRSFLSAIRYCPEADYYFLSDQDDVWEINKLQIAVRQMEQFVNEPVLWYSNYNVVDSELKNIEKDVIKENITSSLIELFYNNVPGCVMGFNKSLMYNVRKIEIDDFRMHDILLFNVALITGKVIHSDISLVYYRQHGDNFIGQYHKKIDKYWLFKKIKQLKTDKCFNYDKYSSQIIEKFPLYLSKYELNNYILLSKYKKSIFNKVALLTKSYTKKGINRTSISIRLKILLGKL